MSDDIATEPQDAAPGHALTEYKRRRAAGLVELGPRDRLLCEYMTHGTSHPRAVRLGLPVNEPLSLEQAATVLDVRRRNARQIFSTPQFQKLFARMVADIRSGAHARMVKTMINIADDEGDGSAATKSVRLKAAKSVLGEQDAALNVSVAVQNSIGPPPGYAYRPCSRPIIEAEPVREPALERPLPQAMVEYRKREAETAAALAAERQAERERLEPVFRYP
jgi:hypothetical protein